MSDAEDDRLDGVEVNTEINFPQVLSRLCNAALFNEMPEIESILQDFDGSQVCRLLSCPASTTFMRVIITQNNIDLLSYMLNLEGFDVEFVYLVSNETLLMFACRIDRVNVVRILLEYGADPNHGTTETTPIVMAAKHASRNVIMLLLKYGADLMAKTNGMHASNLTLAFFNSCWRGFLDICEPFLDFIKNNSGGGVDQKTLVLCQCVLALKMLQDEPNDTSVALSLWRKALELFNVLVKPRFGQLDKGQLSDQLHEIHLGEAMFLQTGVKIEPELTMSLKRTRARFPDFKFCVSPEDISQDFHSRHITVHMHSIILEGCSSIHTQSYIDTFKNLLDEILPVEQTRLCLMILLEQALILDRCIPLLQVNCDVLLQIILRRKLYEHSPGYLTLLMDINIEAMQSTFNSWSHSLMDEKRADKKSVMCTAYTGVAKVIIIMSFLVLSENPAPSQINHHLQLLRKFIALCKTVDCLEPSFHLEHVVLEQAIVISIPDLISMGYKSNGASYENISRRMVEILFACGVSANCRNSDAMTVMFSVLECLAEPQRSTMMELLMHHGAHVDVHSRTGLSAYRIMTELGDCPIDRMLCRTLKCRAAATISFYKIPYSGQLPKILEEFVELHNTHTPTGPFSPARQL